MFDKGVRARLIQSFQLLDATGTGLINRRSLALLLATLDPRCWDEAKVGTLLAGAGLNGSEQVDYVKLVKWLTRAVKCSPTAAAVHRDWLEQRLPLEEVPIKKLAQHVRSRFIEEEWQPFLAEARGHMEMARAKHLAGFMPCEVMPSGAVIEQLVERCLALTKRWHGNANASAFYDIFMDMAEHDGHSAYVFRDVPQTRSPDGYTHVLDGQTRKRLYTHDFAAASRAKHAPMVGRMKQSFGESAIDNLMLQQVVRRRLKIMLMAGRRVQYFFLRALQWKQRRLLSKLGLLTSDMEWSPSSGSPSEDAAARARSDLIRQRLEEHGVEASLASEVLVSRGHIIASYGQVPVEARLQLEAFLESDLESHPMDCPKAVDGELEAFVEHCRLHPGRAYCGSPVIHKLWLLRAMASPALRFLWRSDVERFMQHRYFAVPWTRHAPLLMLPPPVADCHTSGGGVTRCEAATCGQPVVLRPAEMHELTRFRKNIFPYGDRHGVGQSGGGWFDGPAWREGELGYEFGALLCVDESAKVRNHGVIDIEKVIHDCMVLCPDGGLQDPLPGEAQHDAGQNPTVASSIGATIHTQACRASAEEFPLTMQRCKPEWRSDLGAWIDIVQVGEAEDAIVLTARSLTPDTPALAHFLVELRATMMRTFGHKVDFSVSCHQDAQGEFVVMFAPLACLTKVSVPVGQGVMGGEFDYENPDLGELVSHLRLPAATVNYSDGKGNILAMTEEFWSWALEGQPMMRRLYDFNRKLGSAAIVRRFMEEHQFA